MTSNENITVLLVEDEPTLALIIKDTHDTQGFTIHIASDGDIRIINVHGIGYKLITKD